MHHARVITTDEIPQKRFCVKLNENLEHALYDHDEWVMYKNMNFERDDFAYVTV